MTRERANELAERICAIARHKATLLVRAEDTENLIIMVEQWDLKDALMLSMLTEDWTT